MARLETSGFSQITGGLAAGFGIWGGEAEADAVFVDLETEAAVAVVVGEAAEVGVSVCVVS